MRLDRSAHPILMLLSVVLVLVPPALAQQDLQSSPGPEAEFFLISSIEIKKSQIVLKRPTEVTELLLTTDKTVYQDEAGKRLEFKDLRAGDTVWVTSRRNAGGGRVALKIRKGPMTLKELHRRYLEKQ